MVVVVHIGAGRDNTVNRSKRKRLVLYALDTLLLLECSECIEMSSLTNTGYGSNLNLLGSVECDASFITHDTNGRTQGSLLGIVGQRFPISCTVSVFEMLGRQYNESWLNRGLSCPVSLLYQQVVRIIPSWNISSSNLNLPLAQAIYSKHIASLLGDAIINSDDENTCLVINPSRIKAAVKELAGTQKDVFTSISEGRNVLDNIPNQDDINDSMKDDVSSFSTHGEAGIFDRSLIDHSHKLSIDTITDTVGVIWGDTNKLQIATSSGGHFFKIPGRVGCSGIVGAGIDHYRDEKVQLCCMCSGNGEDIIKTNLASAIIDSFVFAKAFSADVDLGKLLVDTVRARGIRFEPLTSKQGFYVGVIVLLSLINGQEYLIYCHSTESFIFGFKDDQGKKRIVASLLQVPHQAGIKFVHGEYRLS